jgi:class 3 adenylate cyclase
MLDFIGELSKDLKAFYVGDFGIRVGIHTGKVVAGIIGSKIVRYDILGEGVLITKKI